MILLSCLHGCWGVRDEATHFPHVRDVATTEDWRWWVAISPSRSAALPCSVAVLLADDGHAMSGDQMAATSIVSCGPSSNSAGSKRAILQLSWIQAGHPPTQLDPSGGLPLLPMHPRSRAALFPPYSIPPLPPQGGVTVPPMPTSISGLEALAAAMRALANATFVKGID